MKTFDRYLLIETLRPFGMVLLLVAVITLIERVLLILDVALGTEGPLRLMVQMLTYMVPHLIALGLPLGFFLGVLLGIRRLSRDSELDALQASGVGLQQLIRPIMLIALIVAGITAVTLGYLQPYARYAYRAMLHTVTNAVIQSVLAQGAFTNINGTTFLAEQRSPDGRQFLNVFLYRSQDDGAWTAVTAKKAELIPGAIGRPPAMLMQDGVTLSGKRRGSGAEQDEAPLTGTLKFSQLKTDIGDGADPMFRSRGEDEREFTLIELWQRRADPPQGVRESEMLAAFHSRIVKVISTFALPFLAIALAHTQRRSAGLIGVATGLISLFAYHEILDFGKNLVQDGSFGVLVGLWLPFSIFFLSSVAAFVWTARRVPRGALPALPKSLGALQSAPAAGKSPD